MPKYIARKNNPVGWVTGDVNDVAGSSAPEAFLDRDQARLESMVNFASDVSNVRSANTRLDILFLGLERFAGYLQ